MNERDSRPTITDLLDRWPSEFEYIDLPEAEILHWIEAADGCLLVVGSRGLVVCEWVYWPGRWPGFHSIDKALHSNEGYCSVPSCLRDGLIYVEGVPDPAILDSALNAWNAET